VSTLETDLFFVSVFLMEPTQPDVSIDRHAWRFVSNHGFDGCSQFVGVVVLRVIQVANVNVHYCMVQPLHSVSLSASA
jgi:hypothetical protein